MLKIYIPDNNQEERKYIIDVLLNEFLGLKYKTEISDSKDYEIELPNKATLIIKDYFFSNFRENKSYLNKENIPFEISLSKNEFTSESNIPVIYGIDDLKINRDKIICSIDIFASSFFMLTRWEEYVNNKRDGHNRFSGEQSLAFRKGFLNRLIVNEYVEMLKNMLSFLGYNTKLKHSLPQLFLTHDIDEIIYWKSLKQFIKIAGSDLIKRKNAKIAFHRLLSYLRTLLSLKKDPYDTFDQLMDYSESVGVKSRFYFMSGGTSDVFDNKYNITEASNIIKNIKNRGHIIGLHGSYNSYNNNDQFKKEKAELEKLVKVEVQEGRQHYLRFEVPVTWQIQNDAGIKTDSTCSYADKVGFRCGTGNEYSVFNILTREKLKLKERPLTVMESSFVNYCRQLDIKEMEQSIKDLIVETKKYNTNFVFLWHNSSFNVVEWLDYESIYKECIDFYKTNNES